MQYRPHRYATQYPIELIAPAGPQQVRVIDVNNSGARVMGARGLRRGDKVRLSVLSQKVEAVVCWAARDKAGIMFRPHLTDHLVDTLRYRQDKRNGWHPGQIGFAEMR